MSKFPPVDEPPSVPTPDADGADLGLGERTSDMDTGGDDGIAADDGKGSGRRTIYNPRILNVESTLTPTPMYDDDEEMDDEDDEKPGCSFVSTLMSLARKMKDAQKETESVYGEMVWHCSKTDPPAYHTSSV